MALDLLVGSAVGIMPLGFTVVKLDGSADGNTEEINEVAWKWL